jgi:hypothetical protein
MRIKIGLEHASADTANAPVSDLALVRGPAAKAKRKPMQKLKDDLIAQKSVKRVRAMRPAPAKDEKQAA